MVEFPQRDEQSNQNVCIAVTEISEENPPFSHSSPHLSRRHLLLLKCSQTTKLRVNYID